MRFTPLSFGKNLMRAARFERPDYIPMTFSINDACWQHYPQDALFGLMEAHPFLFPGFSRPKGGYRPPFAPDARADAPFTDDFGCVWSTSENGITGTVVRHPLAQWESYGAYRLPDSAHCTGMGLVDWNEEAGKAQAARAQGELVDCRLHHGHTFLRLCDLRGYQNLLYDMADEEPLLEELLARLEAFNLALVHRWLDVGAQLMRYPEDLGMQVGPMLSPAQFRRYILPCYRRLMAPAKERGALVHLHSDGDIRLLADDMLGCGADILNLQDLVNGIDWIAANIAGKLCVELDIDRQSITQFAAPEAIKAHVRGAVARLGQRAGGLALVYGLYPGVPLENVAAVMDAMEDCAGYFA